MYRLDIFYLMPGVAFESRGRWGEEKFETTSSSRQRTFLSPSSMIFRIRRLFLDLIIESNIN